MQGRLCLEMENGVGISKMDSHMEKECSFLSKVLRPKVDGIKVNLLTIEIVKCACLIYILNLKILTKSKIVETKFMFIVHHRMITCYN